MERYERINDLGMTREDFPKRLQYFREQILGWTRTRLAKELGMTERTIYHWEHGTRTPQSDIVIRALVALRFQ